MALFDYRAVDSAGRQVKGSIEAESLRLARNRLRGRGIYPVDLRPVEEAADENWSQLFQGRVPVKELAGSMRQLAVLVGAGLPVVDALSAAVEQSGRTRLGRVLTAVKEEVLGGRSLAGALALHPDVFPEMAVNMIRAGEAAGALEPVLDRLAETLEGRVRLRGRVRAALAYPVFMFIVACVVLIFLFIYVVPTVTGIFVQTEQALPLPTQILITLSHAVTSWGWLVLAVIVVLWLVWRRVRRLHWAHRFRDAVRLRFPLIGPVIRQLVLARFTSTMGALLGSGVNVVAALSIAARVSGNLIYEEELIKARERIEQGASLASQLNASPLFPPLISHLVAAGEQTATLDKIFDRLAEGLEEEVNSTVTGLLSLLEPVMILIMGGAVGFIVVSILLPIFEMSRIVGY